MDTVLVTVRGSILDLDCNSYNYNCKDYCYTNIQISNSDLNQRIKTIQ